MIIRRILLIYIFLTAAFWASPSSAFWIWTPETNKWVNPKWAVKDTPGEQLKYALEFYAQEQYAEALRELHKLLKHYPRAREAPDAQFYIATIYEEQGNLMEAFKQYQVVIDKYPFSERSGEIAQKQFDIGNRLLEQQGKQGLLKSITFDEYNIVEVFRQVIKNAPYGDLAPVAQYKIGLYLMERGLYNEARDEFEKVTNDYPESEWAKAARYQVALADSKRSAGAQYDQKITQAAVAEFEDFVETYPEADLTDKAKEEISQLREKEAENNFVVAQFYEKQKNFSAAKIYYQLVIEKYSSSPWADKAREKIKELKIKEIQ